MVKFERFLGSGHSFVTLGVLMPYSAYVGFDCIRPFGAVLGINFGQDYCQYQLGKNDNLPLRQGMSGSVLSGKKSTGFSCTDMVF